MPILELERRDLWKAFGLQAVTAVRGHIPELIGATLGKISTLTPTLGLTQLLDNRRLTG